MTRKNDSLFGLENGTGKRLRIPGQQALKVVASVLVMSLMLFTNGVHGQDARIGDAADTGVDGTGIVRLPIVGEFDMRGLSLPLVTVLIGLLDGFNPCAMFILCFLLVFLIGTKSRKKVFLIGGVFLAVSGVVYFLFITAWLNFFIFISYVAWMKLLVAVIVIFAGLINIKDYFYFQKGLSFTLPPKWKHIVMKRMKEVSEMGTLPAMIVGVITVAFVVNVVELMCTLGFPMIYTQILSTYQLSALSYYSYIALYCLAYMVDDMFVFVLAVLTLNCMEMTQERVRQMKLISGTLMIVLALWFLYS